MSAAWGSIQGLVRDRLLCERVDIGRDVLRLPARQRHVHARVRIEQRKCQRFRTRREFPRDHVKRRGISDVSALRGRHDMAADASGFRETFAVIGICRSRR